MTYSSSGQPVTQSSLALEVSSCGLIISSLYVILILSLAIYSMKKINAICHVTGRGIYAPLVVTHSGDIMVSGVVASSYAEIPHVDYWMTIIHKMGTQCFIQNVYYVDIFLVYYKKERYINAYGYLSYLTIVHAASTLQHSIFSCVLNQC